MSTFYIYPLEGHGQPLLNSKQDLLDNANDTSTLNSLGSAGLSRILEIPLNLMDTTKDQQQMIWLSTNTTPSTNNTTINATIAAEIPSTANEFESNIVTHSFANRKRSIVKRRKSVLSASFTAEDEAEAIRTDREATLAALERGHREHHHTQNEEIQEHQELRELESQEEDLLYSQRNQTFTIEDEEDRPGYFSMNHNSVLSLGRSSVLEREEGSNSDHDQLVPQQVQPEQEEEQQDTKGAIVMNPNDSAIDLRTSVVLDQSDISATKTTDASCSLTITSSIANLSESLPSSPSVTTTTTSSSTTPMTKKKVSSWSPRRIFSSSSSSNSHNETANTKKISKKSSSASLNNTEEASTKPEKFHLSSLFSRKSNNNDKKKKKGTPDHSLDPNSPYLSSTETLLEKPKRVHQFNHTRLPIHTERAIYRLSHMKLTNPRRPLHDQVTISNLMFWYLSVVSQTTNSSAESEPNTAVPINAMTMKAYRMQIKHQQQKNSKNKRRVRHHNNNQVRPENSNAMDMFYQQQKNSQQQLYRQKRNVSAPTLGERPRYQKTHLRSSNSSSEDEDEEEESDDELSSSDELDSTRGLDSEDVFIKKSTKPTKKTKKYSLFSKSDKTTSWLPSFSSPKQHEVVSTREDEDDIPLAMYQKTKN